jgi:hypothetical protein
MIGKQNPTKLRTTLTKIETLGNLTGALPHPRITAGRGDWVGVHRINLSDKMDGLDGTFQVDWAGGCQQQHSRDQQVVLRARVPTEDLRSRVHGMNAISSCPSVPGKPTLPIRVSSGSKETIPIANATYPKPADARETKHGGMEIRNRSSHLSPETPPCRGNQTARPKP